MDLRNLEIFVAVLDEGGVNAAARKLYLSNATVSERLGGLEREMGGSLVTRVPVAATPAGAALEPYARRILRDVAAAVDAVAQLRIGSDARLRIGLMAGGAAELNSPLFRALRRALPLTRLELVDLPLADLESAVIQHRVDAAILRSPVGDPRLRSVQLFLAPRVVVAATDGPLAGAAAVAVADVIDLPITGVHSNSSPAYRDFFLLTPERNGEAPRRMLPAASMAEAAMNVLVAGAIATPTSEVRRVLQLPGITVLPLLGAQPSGPVAVSRRDDRRDTVRTFMTVAAHIAPAARELVPDALPG